MSTSMVKATPSSLSAFRQIFPDADLLAYYLYRTNWYYEHMNELNRSARWEAELILEILHSRALRHSLGN